MAASLAAATAIVGCTATKPEPSRPPLVTIRSDEVRSPFGMASTSSETASRAAVGILEAGGNAIDAAVAAAFTLGSVEPANSGLGGMTYVLIRFADGRTVAIDGSAIVPLRVDRARLAEQQRMLRKGDEDETSGYEFTAVPSTVATLAYCAGRYGSRPLAELMSPAIEAAESGYVLTEARFAAIEKYFPVIRRSRSLRFFILTEGERLPEAGQRFCNQELASTLRAIATGGPDVFYSGAIAAQMQTDMVRNGGFVRRTDLGVLKVRELEPLRSSYRGATVVAFPAPGGGGTVIEALNILERFPRERLVEDTPERVRVMAEAFHVAFEDTLRFRDDRAPSGGGTPRYLTKEFAAERAELVRLPRPLTGDDLPRDPTRHAVGGGTTHVAVADRFGNVVSLSQTIGRFFGSKALTPKLGFPYNSLLEACDLEGPNQVSPLSRVASSMAPAIVEVEGRFLLTIGGSGSSKVPSAISIVVSDVLDRGMSLGPAVAAPRVLWNTRSDRTEMYVEVMPPVRRAVVPALEAIGYRNLHVIEYPAPRRLVNAIGTVIGIERDAATGDWVGVTDNRRGGASVAPRL